MVRFADELHVPVLDAVVHHLDKVPGSGPPNPVAAGLVAGLGADGLEDGLDVRPGLGVAAGHQAWAVARPFLAAGDTAAHVKDALLFQSFAAPRYKPRCQKRPSIVAARALTSASAVAAIAASAAAIAAIAAAIAAIVAATAVATIRATIKTTTAC